MVDPLFKTLSAIQDLEKISLSDNKLTAKGICNVIDAVICSKNVVKSLHLSNQKKPLGYDGEAKIVEKILSLNG
jgi:hypothetical protein